MQYPQRARTSKCKKPWNLENENNPHKRTVTRVAKCWSEIIANNDLLTNEDIPPEVIASVKKVSGAAILMKKGDDADVAYSRRKSRIFSPAKEITSKRRDELKKKRISSPEAIVNKESNSNTGSGQTFFVQTALQDKFGKMSLDLSGEYM